MSLNDNLLVRTVGVSAAIVTALALKYPDRALFDDDRVEIPHKKGWPIIGGLPALLSNAQRVHEFMLDGFTSLNTMTT
jgi:hypothetical protein